MRKLLLRRVGVLGSVDDYTAFLNADKEQDGRWIAVPSVALEKARRDGKWPGIKPIPGFERGTEATTDAALLLFHERRGDNGPLDVQLLRVMTIPESRNRDAYEVSKAPRAYYVIEQAPLEKVFGEHGEELVRLLRSLEGITEPGEGEEVSTPRSADPDDLGTMFRNAGIHSHRNLEGVIVRQQLGALTDRYGRERANVFEGALRETVAGVLDGVVGNPPRELVDTFQFAAMHVVLTGDARMLKTIVRDAQKGVFQHLSPSSTHPSLVRVPVQNALTVG